LELVALQFAVLVLVLALTPTSALFPNHGDVLLYYQDSERLFSGLLPYRDFPFWYPPLALIPMSLPHLLWPVRPLSFETFQFLFLLSNALFCTATAGIVAWIAIRHGHAGGAIRTLTTYAMLVVACAPLLAWRFDAFPTMLSALAFGLFLAERPAPSGVVLGLAIAAKLYPVALAPIFAARYVAARNWRALGSFAAAGAATVALAIVPLAFAARSLPFVDLQLRRGLQIESVPAGAVLLSHLVSGAPVRVVHEFMSVNIASPMTALMLGALPFTIAVGFGVLGVLALRRFSEERGRPGGAQLETDVAYAAAALLLLLATSKVFSSQYIVWLLPFAALMPRPQALAVVALFASTLFVHPLNYERLIALEPTLILVVSWRNLLLLALLLWLVGTHLPRLARSRSSG
jgi:hypothetical protein